MPRLVAAGHEVTGTTRSPERAEAIRAAGATPAVVDAFDADALREAVDEAAPEVVVHQLTALPERFNPRAKVSTTPPTGSAARARATCSTPPGRGRAALRLPEHRIRLRARARGREVLDEDAPLFLDAPPPFGGGRCAWSRRWSARCSRPD